MKLYQECITILITITILLALVRIFIASLPETEAQYKRRKVREYCTEMIKKCDEKLEQQLIQKG